LFLENGGDMGRRIEAADWQHTPVGPLSDWSPALKSAVCMILGSPQPMLVAWGRELTVIYNQACAELLGSAHPAALGGPAAELSDTALASLLPLLQEVRRTSRPHSTNDIGAAGDDTANPGGRLAMVSPLGATGGAAEGALCILCESCGDPAPKRELKTWQKDDLHALQHRLLELTLQENAIEDILQEVVRALPSFSDSRLACLIHLSDEKEETLVNAAAWGLDQDHVRALHEIAIADGNGSCGSAAALRQAVFASDIERDPSWAEFRHRVLPLGWRACWSVPIMSSNDSLLGTFSVYCDRVGLPAPREREFLEMVAQISALILERYDSREELATQKRLLETLNRTGAGLASELDPDELVQMITDAGVEVTGARFGAFFYNKVDEQGESYMLYTLSGVDRAAFEKFPMPRNTEIFAPTFGGHGIVRSDDITADHRYGRNAPNRGMPEGHLPVRSYLAAPVLSHSGEVIGGLFFGHPEPGRFTAHHEMLLEGIAGQAAIALDNARLYQEAQKEIEERRSVERALRLTQKNLEKAQERVELALAAGAILGTWVWEVQADRFTADDRFARSFGLDPRACAEGISLHDALPPIHPEDRSRVEKLVNETIAKGGSYRAEYRVRQQDGAYRWVEANGRCDLDDEGRPVHFPGVLIDIEQRRRAETDLRRREADLALLLDATADGFYAVDTNGATTRCNAAFLRMLGFEREEDVIGKQLHAMIHHTHPDGTHYHEEDCPIYRVARDGGMAHVDNELLYHTDGTAFPVEYWVRPVMWQGELQGAVCTIVDISERKRAEEARQLLLRELNHRVKNLFAITSGMIQMTARNSTDVNEMATALSGRLMSLARAHELITTSITSNQTTVAPASLDALVSAVMDPHIAERPEALHASGPEVEIGPTAATSVALILHELATNAAKYGALSTATGRVDLSWTRDDQRVTLTWRETGGPDLAGAPQRTGFGSQLARLSATGQLGGGIEYTWNPGGVEIVLTAALERLLV
ncbi:MAG: GAF domain-containing protein, partial [Rhodobacteraceae bacterium]|nr:GAF domain-containing protein [Paracoccaceae bacterium]